MIQIDKINLLDDAVEDLNRGEEFYSRIEKYLGGYFRDSLIRDIDLLYGFSGIHPRVFGYYRMLSRKFPFCIYYEIQERTVLIIAILPMNQDPDKIENRLSG